MNVGIAEKRAPQRIVIRAGLSFLGDRVGEKGLIALSRKCRTRRHQTDDRPSQNSPHIASYFRWPSALGELF